ncbi:unnamed protein product [Rotaria magnacalcarata]|nr:unnamed protein product [Rotaria magnacalcarata]
MFHRLWTIYLKSGMGQLINQSKIQCNYPVDVKIWPEEVKNMLSSREINKKNEHKICSQLVECHLQVLHYNYHIQAIKYEYNTRHNPNEYQKNIMKQLCHSMYKKETTEQEVHFIQQQINYYNLSDQSFEDSSLLQSTSIHSIENSLIRQHLLNQYKDIIAQSKTFFLNVRMTIAEEQQDKYKEIHDLEIKKMWLDRHIMNHQEKLPLVMIDLINECCHKIHECIQCIYKFKIQPFLSSAL